MAEIVITCQLSCQRCDWNTGGSIPVDESDLFPEILKFIGQSWKQHPDSGPSGELLVSWKPLSAEKS